MKLKIFILSMLSLMMFQGSYAQKKVKAKRIILSGLIKDSNNEPIKNAIIKVHNSEWSERTNSKGFYKIRIQPETKKILIITPKYGYREIVLDNELSLDVIFPAVVSPEQKKISHEEMVDLGYMKRKKSENSYNIALASESWNIKKPSESRIFEFDKKLYKYGTLQAKQK